MEKLTNIFAGSALPDGKIRDAETALQVNNILDKHPGALNMSWGGKK